MQKITLLLALLLACSLSAQQKKTTTKKPVQKTVVQKAEPEKPATLVVPYRVGQLWGFSDTLGNIKAKPIYREIKSMLYFGDAKSSFVVRTGQKYFVIDQNQKPIMPEITAAAYDSIAITRDSQKSVLIYRKGKTGIFVNGKELIKPVYDKIEPTFNESFIVTTDGMVGLINGAGKLVVPTEYIDIYPSWDDEDRNGKPFVWSVRGAIIRKKVADTRIATPKKDGEVMVVEEVVGIKEYKEDNWGTFIKSLKSRYDRVDDTNYNGVARVVKDGKMGIFSQNENAEIITPAYKTLQPIEDDHGKPTFIAVRDEKYGIVKSGNEIFLPLEYDFIKFNREIGTYAIEKGEKMGIAVMNTVYPVIPAKYDALLSAINIPVSARWRFGIFKVKTAGGIGYVGENGVEFFKD